MTFLQAPPRFLFFTGKGGVGKTSLACASAVRLAESGKRVLLVSTDPASNVGQVFGIAIGNVVTRIEGVTGLSALEIDPLAAAQSYRERILAPLRGKLPDAVLESIAEQLSGACTTEIAAFDEFTALLTDPELAGVYDHVVFDTAPTGHTIRLLQLAGAWSTFLASGKGDASCLGPLAGLEKQRAQYIAAVAALTDPSRTRLVLVARAQQAALREVARTLEELSACGQTQQHLVVNGILPMEEAKDALAQAIIERERAALAAIPEVLTHLPRDLLPLKPFNLVGLAALRALLAPGSAPIPATADNAGMTHPPRLAELVDGLAAKGNGLIMLMGKGGVGKTTLASAIAVELAHRGLPVHLTTSDPAAHLVETLASDAMDSLEVSRIDPHEAIARYRDHVLATRGAQLDAEGRSMLEEDLRSPCTEEIAVFQAFSQAIGEADDKFVVMDTAPTGHTLLLMDATGAYHRELARQESAAPQDSPMTRLRDGERTKVIIVTLAEATPVQEAARLQDDLARAGIDSWAWIVNQSVAAAPTESALLRQRAQNEIAHIHAVTAEHARRYAVVPLSPTEPVGFARLRHLVESR